MYSKEELTELIIKNPEEYNSYKKTMGGELDLTELDFSNITLEEIDFSNTELVIYFSLFFIYKFSIL